MPSEARSAPEMPAILDELVRASRQLSPAANKRVRFAVTPDEYEMVRRYCFAIDGYFCGMVRNHPLVVEEHPEHPLVAFEGKPAKAG